MKSYNHLWEIFISDENYYLAVSNSTRGKTGKSKKHRRARYYKTHATEMKDEFMEYVLNYKHRDHKPIEVYDGIRRKQRKIYVPNVEEQILHHMVVNVLKPIFMKSMYEHSYGSIPGRGAHSAKKRIEKWIRKQDKHLNIYTARQMLSYMGWFKCTDCYGAYLKHIKPNVSFRTLRRYVSRWDKKHNKEINYGLV